MRIVIVNGYVRENCGDAALMSVLCSEMQRVFPDAEVSISTQEDVMCRPEFEGHRTLPSLIRFIFGPDIRRTRRIVRAFQVIGIWIASLFGRTVFRRLTKALPGEISSLLCALCEADLVISMAGGYLTNAPGAVGGFYLFLTLLPLMIAENSGVCVVFAPQSIGPFNSRFERILAARSLDRAQLVEVREEISLEIVKQLGVKSALIQVPDLGFLFGHEETRIEAAPVTSGELIVGVTVRNWFVPSAQDRFEGSVAAVMSELQQRVETRVLLIPHVTSDLGEDDDRIANSRIYARLQDRSRISIIEDRIGYQEIKSIYAGLDILIGTRFHSVIFALTSLTPAIAIAYEHKTRGIMRDLGLERWVLNIEDVNARTLGGMASELINERSSYIDHLSRVLPPYIERAHEASAQIHRLVNLSGK
jgi:colanic acid/amylovoran biosynthesis protein